MPIIYRPGVYTMVFLIKKICHFVTKHRGSMIPTFEAALTPAQMTVLNAAIDAIVALCAVFDIVYPNIKE